MIIVPFILAAVAASSAPHAVRCEVLEGDRPVRHFSVWFTPDGGALKGVKVEETDRIFTPGNAVAVFSTRTGVTNIPDKRPGKWSGVAAGDVFAFTLAPRDGGAAAFTLTPDAARPGNYALKWNASVRLGFDNQAADGTGTCADMEETK